MSFQYSQNIFKTSEQIQVISLYSFRDAVDNVTDLCIQAIDQLPCMLIKTKAAQGTFYRIVCLRLPEMLSEKIPG